MHQRSAWNLEAVNQKCTKPTRKGSFNVCFFSQWDSKRAEELSDRKGDRCSWDEVGRNERGESKTLRLLWWATRNSTSFEKKGSCLFVLAKILLRIKSNRKMLGSSKDIYVCSHKLYNPTSSLHSSWWTGLCLCGKHQELLQEDKKLHVCLCGRHS